MSHWSAADELSINSVDIKCKELFESSRQLWSEKAIWPQSSWMEWGKKREQEKLWDNETEPKSKMKDI